MVALHIVKQQEYYTAYMFHYVESVNFCWTKHLIFFSFGISWVELSHYSCLKQLQWLNSTQEIPNPANDWDPESKFH